MRVGRCSFHTTGSYDWRASSVRDAVTATSQFAVADVFRIVVGAARFVAGDAADATVDGLAFEAEAGTVDFSDDVPPRECSYTGALLESFDGVEDRVPAAQATVDNLGLQRRNADRASVDGVVAVRIASAT
jgi:hypothetical protein